MPIARQVTMTKQVPESPQTPSECEQEVVFRSVTPVFHYKIEGDATFTHSGGYKGGRFQVELSPSTPSQAAVDELFKYATQQDKERIFNQNVSGFPLMGDIQCFLIVDEFYPRNLAQIPIGKQTIEAPIADGKGGTSGTVRLEIGNAVVEITNKIEIHEAAMTVFRLHSSAGFLCHQTYQLRRPPALGINTSHPNTPQSRRIHTGAVSLLRQTDFDSCRFTIDRLLANPLGDSTTLEKVLLLGMQYHRSTFDFNHTSHAFLVLMVVFEALFKKEEEGVNKAASRIGRLLGATKKESQDIFKAFDNPEPDVLCKIRNQIAHGNPSLSKATVETKYPILYKHVTSAIIALLNLPLGVFHDTKDYYDELSFYVDNMFKNLPAV